MTQPALAPSQLLPTTSTRATLLSVAMLTVLAGAIVSAGLPGMQQHFSSHPRVDTFVRLVVTLPALAVALIAPGLGLVADKVGRKRLLVWSLALYVISGTSGLYLQSLESILVGRFLLGVAVAGSMTAASTIVGDLFNGESREKFLGIQGASMSLSGVVFLPAGGILADRFGWHAPFVMYLAAVPILIAVILVLVETSAESRASKASLDNEIVGPYKLKVAAIALVVGVLSASFYLVPVQLPFLVVHDLGSSKSIAGLLAGLSVSCGAITSFNYSRIVRVVGPAGMFVTSGLLMGGGWIAVGLNSQRWSILVVGLVIGGLGVGMYMANSVAWSMRLSPAAVRGRVVGLVTAAVFFGQFISPILAAPLIDGVYVARAFVTWGALLLTVAILAGVFLLITPRRRLQQIP